MSPPNRRTFTLRSLLVAIALIALAGTVIIQGRQIVRQRERIAQLEARARPKTGIAPVGLKGVKP